MTYETVQQALLRLESFHLAKLNFNLDDTLWRSSEINDPEYRITFTHVTNESADNLFGVMFEVSVKNPENTFILDFEFLGMFETQGFKISKEELDKNPFFRINAPAIMFPYIRAFVSNFMLTSGFKPLILPAINFSQTKKIEDTQEH